MRSDSLTEREARMVLEQLLYTLRWEDRRKLAQALPVQTAKLYGHELAVTGQHPDGTVLTLYDQHINPPGLKDGAK